MAIRTYKVTLDSKNTIAPEPVFLRQGDKTGAVVIDATLMDNGSPVSLSGITPMFKANTADGQAVIADSTGFTVTDSANGKFTYQVPNALSAVPGKITTAYFSLSDSSGTESTFDVAFIIKKAVDITKPQAEDYITIIDGTIQSLQQKIDAMNTGVQTILNNYNTGDFYNKAQTDSKDAATLASAKAYADAQDATVRSAYYATKDAMTAGDTATLTAAKSYADTYDVFDSDWQDLSGNIGPLFEPWGTGTNNKPMYRIIGNMLMLRGTLTPKNDIDTSASGTNPRFPLLANLSISFTPGQNTVSFGTNGAYFSITTDSSGNINMERYIYPSTALVPGVAKQGYIIKLAGIWYLDSYDVGKGVQSFMRSTLIDVGNAIDTTKMVIGYGTDYHFDIYSNSNPMSGSYDDTTLRQMWRSGLRKQLNILSLSTKTDAVLFGGDNCDHVRIAATGHDVMLREHREFANQAFRYSKCPVFLLKGNHDMNYYLDKHESSVLKNAEIVPLYRQDKCIFGEHRLDASNYFYKDFPDKKVRMIGLDNYDLPETVKSDGTMEFDHFQVSAMQQPQLNWLANDALADVPEDYAVIIFMHAPMYGIATTGTTSINHDVLKTILEAFETGASGTAVGSNSTIPVSVSYNFTKAGHVAAVVAGHNHVDRANKVNGINYVQTRCSTIANDNQGGVTRMSYFGTVKEDAFDIITIDAAARTLEFKRVGSGQEDSSIALRKFAF